MKQVAWYTTLILLTITGLILVWQFRLALVLFLFSLAISSAFLPLIDMLTSRRIPRGLALLISYSAAIALIVWLLWIMGGVLLDEVEQASNQIALAYEKLHPTLAGQELLSGMFPPPEDLFFGQGSGEGIWFVQNLMNATSSVAAFLGSLGLVIILSLYWSADRLNFERLLLSLIPVEQRARVRLIWRGIEKGVGAYLRSELFQSLLAGFLLWLGYRLMGLDYPVLLAFVGALAWLIPWFGAVIAMIPAFLVGAGTDLTLGIIAAAYTLIILAFQEYVIEPKIFRRNSYNPVILVLVILALTEALGFVGLILAPLLSAIIQNISKYLLGSPMGVGGADLPLQDPADTLILLRQRLAAATQGLQELEEAPSIQMTNLVERLDQLVEKTEQYFDKVP